MPNFIPGFLWRCAAVLSGGAAGGLCLTIAAVLALLWANSPLAAHYSALLHWGAGPVTLHHVINDGLMSLFFLLVGLEIRREVTCGSLAGRAALAGPGLAAAGGMLMPALVYLLLTGAFPALRPGWAVPTATDIAFSLGVMALLPPACRRAELRLFLTALAILDDLGAVLIIALAYSQGLALLPLLLGGGVLAGLALLGRRKNGGLWLWLPGGLAVWGCFLLSGIHAALAGVALACVVPGTDRQGNSLLHQLEQRLHGPVTFLIVPLFGFANAGVPLGGGDWSGPGGLAALAVALGLLLGKPLGVLAGIALARRLKLSPPLPGGAGGVLGMALLCGIGFTMSLFVNDLAFGSSAAGMSVKAGVLGGSLLSALLGWAVLRWGQAPDRPSAHP